MKTGYDFKQEWPKLKAELVRVGKEAMALAREGEKEVLRVSHKGKLHIDVAALRLKQEHLYKLIGKEYIKARCPKAPTPALKKLAGEWGKIEKEIKALNKKLKTISLASASS